MCWKQKLVTALRHMTFLVLGDVDIPDPLYILDKFSQGNNVTPKAGAFMQKHIFMRIGFLIFVYK